MKDKPPGAVLCLHCGNGEAVRCVRPMPPSDACGRLDLAPQARPQTRKHRILLSGGGLS